MDKGSLPKLPAQLDKIDILVNNAGLERHEDFWRLPKRITMPC